MSHNNVYDPTVTMRQVNRYTSSLKTSSPLSKLSSIIITNLHTLYLFTKSDIKTVILPTTAFAVANSLSGNFTTSSSLTSNSVSSIRLLLTILWTWTGLLLETVANQRLPPSILEDTLNKPWRPLVSSRISTYQARRLLILLIVVFYILSLSLGAQGPGLALIVFTYLYNDLQGADDNLVARNVLNACGLMSFGAGATLIASERTPLILFGEAARLSNLGWTWIVIIGLVITTTVSTQDLEDVVGDSKRGRRTLPLIWGLRATRLYLAATIVAWNAVCVAFWRAGVFAAAGPVGVSTALAVNLVFGASMTADKRSWKLWCLWLMTVYALPALTATGEGQGAEALVRIGIREI